MLAPTTRRPQVIVIGAGIAGLAAAHFLAGAGVAVKVLEASGRVGGRMITDVMHGVKVDRGAQFLSSEYRLLLSLAADVGLHAAVRETSPWSAILRDGNLRRLRADNPFDALTSGLLEPTAWARLGWRSWRARRPLQDLPLDDYSRWSGFDTESVSSWSNRELHRRVTDYLFEPMLHGFYFQDPEDCSRSLAMALLAFGMRRARTLTLADGIGSLPEALAARLDIALDCPVLSVECGADAVTVVTAAATMEADHVVLAIPAAEARRLHAGADEAERRLLDTPYSACINLSVMADPAFRLPRGLADVYGVLVPRQERRNIAAIGIESNKRRDGSAGGQVFNIMLSDPASRAMMSMPDEAIVRAVMPEAEKFFPGLPAQLVASRTYRWPQAEPRSRVGRSGDLARYRASRGAGRRVLLAGDYMSMPYTEGAAESGQWAARQILEAVGHATS